MMAELFQTCTQNITMHLKNIYDEDELEENSTCKDFLQVQNEGKSQVKRKQKFYNMDMIISFELQALNNLVEQYLIFAEGQALSRIPI
jgi:hypothetical protein